MLDVERAVRRNRTFAQQLGRQEHFDAVVEQFGFDASTLGGEPFAEAVSGWRTDHGLGDDEIVRPNSWAASAAEPGVGDVRSPNGKERHEPTG